MKTNLTLVGKLFLIITASLFCNALHAQTKVIAHRGFWDTEGSAQNSIAALKKAHETGAYGSEFDVWLTADGVPIVNHDDSIPGFRIETSTYKELQSVTLSNGEKIPTLEDYLRAGKRTKGTQLILEIKTHKRKINEDRLVAKTVALVRRYGLEYQTDYIAFSLNACKELRIHAPYATIAYLNGDICPADLKEMGFNGLDYNHKVLTAHPEWIKEAKELGLTTNVWTVNTPEQMQWFIDQGVDFITTDNPLALIELLGK